MVNANDAMWPRGATVMNNCNVALYPNPSTVPCQESIVPCFNLTLHQYCENNEQQFQWKLNCTVFTIILKLKENISNVSK